MEERIKQGISKILKENINVSEHEDYTDYEQLILSIGSFMERNSINPKTKIMDKENIVNIIYHLFKSGYISIRVDIKTEHAKCGDGKWNKTQTFLKVGDELIPLEEGDVEIL